MIRTSTTTFLFFVFVCGLRCSSRLASAARWFDHPEFDYESPRPQVVIKDSGEIVDTRIEKNRKLSTYVSLEEKFADHAYDNQITELRITYDYRFLDTDANMCRYEGQVVNPYLSERGYSGTTYTCEAADVYQDSWKTLQQETADWMADFMELYIYKDNVADDFVISNPNSLSWDLSQSGYNVSDTSASAFTYPNTDLVIFMSLHKCPTGVAGYAGCYQYDGRFGSSSSGRCTVGYFNWCPSQIDIANKDDPTVKQQDRYLFLHETAHVLGCCKPDDFIDPASSTEPPSKLSFDAATTQMEIFSNNDAGARKTVRFISTPKVQATMREQSGCDSIPGAELEDVPLGAGAHYEARAFGGEVMAYGLLSSEPYLSDVTLAYLEDSGHYLVNRTYATGCDRYGTTGCTNHTYSMGGRFMEATATDFSQSFLSALFAGSDSFDESLVVTRTLGFLRWGRLQGCDFFMQSPDSWTSHYTCTNNLETGCTADNRMSARCSVKSWGSGGSTVSNPISCIASSSSNCGSQNTNAQTPELPNWARYTSKVSTGQGGYSDSFDFAPVRLGYWNCLDSKPTTTERFVNGNNTNNFDSDTFTALSNELELFGGQMHCEDCRCFDSTLREFGSIKSLEYASYGLCYVSNCYRSDYLQVGVRSRDGGVDWVGCPSGGGSLYIPGFTGSITCPDAATFCTYEDITGRFYGETNLLLAWIFLGIVVGVPFLLFVWCCGFPNHAKPCLLRCKLCCGIELARDERVEYARNIAKKRIQRSNKQMNRLARFEQKLLERGGSNIHMLSIKDINVNNIKTMNAEEKMWAREQVHHNRKLNKYCLCKRLQTMPLGRKYRDKYFDTEGEVMQIALAIREKDPKIAGLAGAATFVLAKIDSRTEQLLEHYTEVQLQGRDGKAAWVLSAINTIWIFGSMFMLIMAIGTAFEFGVWEDSENAAPFLWLLGILGMIFSCMGSVGSSTLRPSLTLLFYFYTCAVLLIYILIAVAAFFLYMDWMEDQLDEEWYRYRMFFPNEYHNLERSDAVDKFEEDTQGYGLIGILSLAGFTIFSLVAGTYCSVVIMTLDSIVLNLFIGMNLFLGSLAVIALAIGSVVLQTGVLIAVPTVDILLSVFILVLAFFGIYNDMHLSFRTVSTHVSFHRTMFRVYFWIDVVLSLMLIITGVAVLGSKEEVESFVDDLDEEEVSDVAGALNQGGSYDSLKSFVVATILFMAVLMLVEGFTLLAMLPVIRYMDGLHAEREKKLIEYEKDADFARKEGVLKYLPADGLSIIPGFAPYRKKIRDARKKAEGKEGLVDGAAGGSTKQHTAIEMRAPHRASYYAKPPPRAIAREAPVSSI